MKDFSRKMRLVVTFVLLVALVTSLVGMHELYAGNVGERYNGCDKRRRHPGRNCGTHARDIRRDALCRFGKQYRRPGSENDC